MGYLRTGAKFLSSPIAFPGVLFILYGVGIDYSYLLGPGPTLTVS